MEKKHMQPAKVMTLQFDTWNKNVQCSVGSERASQSKTVSRSTIWKKNIATRCTSSSQKNQPLWNEVTIYSSPTWMIGWPPHFSKAVVRGSKIKTANRQLAQQEKTGNRPLWHLWHDVAIRTVFISFTKRCTHFLFLAPVAILQIRHSNKKELTKHELAGHWSHKKTSWWHKQRVVLLAKYFNQGSCDGQFHLLLNRLTAKRQYYRHVFIKHALAFICPLCLLLSVN